MENQGESVDIENPAPLWKIAARLYENYYDAAYDQREEFSSGEGFSEYALEWHADGDCTSVAEAACRLAQACVSTCGMYLRGRRVVIKMSASIDES